MATQIFEFFGFRSTDTTQVAVDHAHHQICPFLGERCEKTLNDGLISGVCTLKPARSGPVVCCPVRLYAEDYRILQDVADMAFGPGLRLFAGTSAATEARLSGTETVAVFGKRWAGELRLPQRQGQGSYFVDWILARLDPSGDLTEFVAIEVQSIDTTGNYRDGRTNLLGPSRAVTPNTAGLNWENVNKRILPQLIYKGNVLQREALCQKGLFFVAPTPVHDKIMQRLGGQGGLHTYPLQSSSITFMAYNVDEANAAVGQPLPLVRDHVFTTNIGQVAQAFAGPGVMPPQDSYRDAILTALKQ